MSTVTALIAGALIGARHSFEADHIVAISTLVDDETKDDPESVGLWWGVGHALPIIVAGIAFLALGVALPELVTSMFEVIAGLILLYLGVKTLMEISDRFGVERHSHSHDDDSHYHMTSGSGRFQVGTGHSHVDGESFLVGIVHGLAGSGALVVVLVATAPTVTSSIAFLAAFSVVSIVTMATLSLLWGRVVTAWRSKALRAMAGVASLVIGGALIVEQFDHQLAHGLGHSHQHVFYPVVEGLAAVAVLGTDFLPALV